MSDPIISGLIAKAYAALPSVAPGYKPRSQQQQMIKRASALFTRETVGVIEAPTGTGKSTGYLIPGIITAAQQDRVLIISTATASLQDQLVTRDIPIALAAISAVSHEGVSIKGAEVATAKGRDRYVCPMKIESLADATPDLFQAKDSDAEVFAKLRDRFFSSQWDGIRDSLSDPIPAPMWRKIANSSSSCTGRRCSLNKDCPYYEVQERIKNARIVVTNHDYLLTNLARVPNSPLADKKAVYVFDEAHHLGDKLISAFARTLDFENFFDDEDVELAIRACGDVRAALDLGFERMRGIWAACNQSIAGMLGDGMQHRFRLGEAPRQFIDLLDNLSKDMTEMGDLLSTAKDKLRLINGATAEATSPSMIEEMHLGRMIGEINEATECLLEFCGDSTMARWLARSRSTLEICCSPFDPAEKARRHLWPVVNTALLTSATIAPCGVFEPTLFSLGLPSNTPTLKLDSPFDYTQARMYVPRMAVDGGDKLHSSRVSAYLKSITSEWDQHQGILVYFTSRKLMLECYEAMNPAIKPQILLQGQWQPSGLLAEHRLRIDAGKRSIIFGMDSVGEGVDLPGDYCTCVVITRLPFPAVDDPVIAMHGEHLQNKGLQPFNILTLPVAGRKFAQVCGRLMRREGDHGEILVLDRRLISKRYGRQLIASTPFRSLSASA